MSTSTIFTVGTALRRAQDSGFPVTVLVEGHWLDGQVGGLDGDGVVLVGDVGDQVIIRLGSVSVVRVHGALSAPEPPRPDPSTVYEAGPVTVEAEVPDDLPLVIEPRREHAGAVEAQRQLLAALAD